MISMKIFYNSPTGYSGSTSSTLISRPLPVHNFKGFGSTPRGTIPNLWEHSHKSSIALLGVLPNPLNKVYLKLAFENWIKMSKDMLLRHSIVKL